jgi:hypothetical protein
MASTDLGRAKYVGLVVHGGDSGSMTRSRPLFSFSIRGWYLHDSAFSNIQYCMHDGTVVGRTISNHKAFGQTMGRAG